MRASEADIESLRGAHFDVELAPRCDEWTRDVKNTWIRISDEAELQMTTFADRQPNVPIGVAFLDAAGVPRWIGDDATLRAHAPCVRGCWPQVYELDARDQ